jgi:hypothetical protein
MHSVVRKLLDSMNRIMGSQVISLAEPNAGSRELSSRFLSCPNRIIGNAGRSNRIRMILAVIIQAVSAQSETMTLATSFGSPT